MTNPDSNIEEKIHPNNEFIYNLWVLLIYAFDFFELAKKRENISLEDGLEDMPFLTAKILCYTVKKRIKRNLTIKYERKKTTLRRVRGKIDILYTERHSLLSKGQIHCSFDDLNINTPINRYVLAALEKSSRMSFNRGFNKTDIKNEITELARECKSLSTTLRSMGVIGNKPNERELAFNSIDKQSIADRDILIMSYIVLNSKLPTKLEDDKSILQYDKEKSLEKLYEKAITRFYHKELDKSKWEIKDQSSINFYNNNDREDFRLPLMRPDIILKYNKKHCIIIDTKFKSFTSNNPFNEKDNDAKSENNKGKKTFRSADIYQIYTYLRSQEDGGKIDKNATGILLYPTKDQEEKDLDISFSIDNHKIQFSTIDLMNKNLTIKIMSDRLLEIINRNTNENLTIKAMKDRYQKNVNQNINN